MGRIIYIYYIIHQFLYFTRNIEALNGIKVTTANDYEYPFIASLQYINGRHLCTGSLITYSHVLTAAHCLENEHPERVRIVLGLANLRNAIFKYKVARWYTYNDWADSLRVPRTVINDLAVVTLLSEIIERNVHPIRLSELNKKQVQGKTATILGWSCVARLQRAVVNILEDNACVRQMHLITNEKETITPAVMCSTAEPYVLMQGGDSGGPLLNQYGDLLGVNAGEFPDRKYAWGNFSIEFLRPYQVNLHFSIDYPNYRLFIVNVTGYH